MLSFEVLGKWCLGIMGMGSKCSHTDALLSAGSFDDDMMMHVMMMHLKYRYKSAAVV